jgi:putative membrane protein
VVLAVVTAALASTGAAAQEPGSRMTREFVQATAQSDRFEILEAHIVLTESSDPQVRGFAQQMIEDHQQTSSALEQAVARGGLRPPTPGISADQAQMLGALQGLRGREVDSVYLRQQVLAHRSALTTEQAYATSGDVPAVRQAAALAAPAVAAHQERAEQLRARSAGS